VVTITDPKVVNSVAKLVYLQFNRQVRQSLSKTDLEERKIICKLKIACPQFQKEHRLLQYLLIKFFHCKSICLQNYLLSSECSSRVFLLPVVLDISLFFSSSANGELAFVFFSDTLPTVSLIKAIHIIISGI
jgi:hypothetical protein